MEKVITVAQVIVPIFVCVYLGVLARRKSLMKTEEIRGLQQFVLKFGLPCVVFNSCLTADIGAESLTSMALVLPLLFVSAMVAFRLRRNRFPYHNLPMLFAGQETGMLGIPLFMILFGADQAYRVGVLDMTQAVICLPVIALLSSDTGDNPSPAGIVKKVFSSPIMILGLSGLFLNLSGLAGVLKDLGLLGLVTETAGFLTQPVSALMMFAVGYNFSLDRTCRRAIFRISGIRLGLSLIFGLIGQLGLSLIAGVDPLTRWALLLYWILPGSFVAPSLGKNREDYAVASGVCSLMTVVTLSIFCVMAAVVA